MASDPRQACSVNILRCLWEHVTMHSQIFEAFELACPGVHQFACVALAHFGGLIAACGFVDSASAVVAASPAVLNGRVVAR